MNRRRAVLALLVLAFVTLLVGMMVEPKADSDRSTAHQEVAGEANRAISARLARPHRPPIKSDSIDTRVVAIETRERSAGYFMTDPELVGSVWGSQELATPKSTTRVNRSTTPAPLSESRGAGDDSRADSGVIVPVTTFPGPTIDDDKTETGLRFIPPDPIGAAGPDHLVSVINVLVNFYQQDGTADFQDSLFDFFTDLGPLTLTFDPKVLYDQFAGRFVIVTMDVTDTELGDDANTSRILVAVSDDSDPNGSWCLGAIDAFSTFVGEASEDPRDHWAEYPGLGVDEEAVYITAEMRTFLDQQEPDEFGGVRLWIIDKLADGLYDCGSNPVDLSTVDVYDPFAGGGIVLTSQPAHVYGSAPVDVGTFLVSKGNLTDGTNEFAQVIRIDEPLGTTSFTQSFVDLGNIEDLTGDPDVDPPLPNAPQSGSAELIDTNDRRTLDAVWRDDGLYFTATIDPKPGDPDAGEATAFWSRIDTTNLGSLVASDRGVITGEDIGAATHTFYPSIAVDNTGTMAIGFAASGTAIFPSAYFTFRAADDPAGTTDGSTLVQAGEASYFREFGTNRNRWGDYTGTAVHPTESGCFWIFNQYAGEQDGMDTPPENGRWETQWAEFCVGENEIFADGFESGDTTAWSEAAP